MKLKKIKYHTSSGRPCYALMHPTLGLIDAYSIYLEEVSSTSGKSNTISSYAQDLKRFFEYITVFTDMSKLDSAAVKTTVLREIIVQFPEYLTDGKLSEGDFSQYAAQSNNIKPVAVTTAERILSTVNGFLTSSAILNSELNQAKEADLIDIDVELQTMFGELTSRRKLSENERVNLVSRSMLASVIRGGGRYTKNTLFKVKGKGSKAGSGVSKAFPFTHIEQIFEHAKSYRDICLWALLAGTGIRLHECAQVLLRDVDIENQSVSIIDPNSRKPIYADIDKETREKLSWKSRQTESVYFLEPFKSIFFNNLQSYLAERMETGAYHEFLFVSLSNFNIGEPVLGSSSLNTEFKEAQCALGLDSTYTIHSLRHFYGVWCLNFLPIGKDRYGLPLSVVQGLMGHASPKNTEVYAVVDKFLLTTVINTANTLLAANPINALEVAERALSNRLEQTKKEYFSLVGL